MPAATAAALAAIVRWRGMQIDGPRRRRPTKTIARSRSVIGRVRARLTRQAAPREGRCSSTTGRRSPATVCSSGSEYVACLSAGQTSLSREAGPPAYRRACWHKVGTTGLAPGGDKFWRFTDSDLLTGADCLSRRWRRASFGRVNGLLMRFGFAAIRGSNPRASALLSAATPSRRRGGGGADVYPAEAARETVPAWRIWRRRRRVELRDYRADLQRGDRRHCVGDDQLHAAGHGVAGPAGQHHGGCDQPGGCDGQLRQPAATDALGLATPSVSCEPAPGSTFPVGATTVTCTATDPDATPNSVSVQFTVTVVPVSVLSLAQPADITTDATGSHGSTVAYRSRRSATRPTRTRPQLSALRRRAACSRSASPR